MAADYPGRSRERRRRYSTGTVTAVATREVSHGGMIERIAASAAKKKIARPVGPLSAPPNEIGESFVGAFGAEGRAGAFGGADVGVVCVPAVEETGTAVGGTSVTPCCGTNALEPASRACGRIGAGESCGFRIDGCAANAAVPRCAVTTRWCLTTACGFAFGLGAGAVAYVTAVGGGAVGKAGACGVAAGAGAVGTLTVISFVAVGPGAAAEATATCGG